MAMGASSSAAEAAAWVASAEADATADVALARSELMLASVARALESAADADVALARPLVTGAEGASVLFAAAARTVAAVPDVRAMVYVDALYADVSTPETVAVTHACVTLTWTDLVALPVGLVMVPVPVPVFVSALVLPALEVWSALVVGA